MRSGGWVQTTPDVYFPEIDKSKFDLVWEEKYLADEKNKFDFTFQKFERK